jgi:hypothetical protein
MRTSSLRCLNISFAASHEEDVCREQHSRLPIRIGAMFELLSGPLDYPF